MRKGLKEVLKKARKMAKRKSITVVEALEYVVRKDQWAMKQENINKMVKHHKA